MRLGVEARCAGVRPPGLDSLVSRTGSRVEEMSTECSDLGEEFWLPEEFLDDDFFSEEEKAAVAARSESDEEDSLAGLSRRLAGLLGDVGERKPPAKVGFVVACMELFGSLFAPSPSSCSFSFWAHAGVTDCYLLCRRPR